MTAHRITENAVECLWILIPSAPLVIFGSSVNRRVGGGNGDMLLREPVGARARLPQPATCASLSAPENTRPVEQSGANQSVIGTFSALC